MKITLLLGFVAVIVALAIWVINPNASVIASFLSAALNPWSPTNKQRIVGVFRDIANANDRLFEPTVIFRWAIISAAGILICEATAILAVYKIEGYFDKIWSDRQEKILIFTLFFSSFALYVFAVGLIVPTMVIGGFWTIVAISGPLISIPALFQWFDRIMTPLDVNSIVFEATRYRLLSRNMMPKNYSKSFPIEIYNKTGRELAIYGISLQFLPSHKMITEFGLEESLPIRVESKRIALVTINLETILEKTNKIQGIGLQKARFLITHSQGELQGKIFTPTAFNEFHDLMSSVDKPVVDQRKDQAALNS